VIRILRAGLFLASLVTLAAVPVAAGKVQDQLLDLVSGVPESAVPTGILYDRALPPSSAALHDGTSGGPAVSLAEWRQLYHAMRVGALAAPIGPPLEQVIARSEPGVGRGEVPIALMNVRYDRIRPDALERGALVIEGGRLRPGTGEATESHRLFAAAPFRDRTFHGREVTFTLSSADYFSNDATPPGAIAVDFADGRGFVPLAFDRPEVIRYATPGPKLIRLELARAGAPALATSFTFEVAALETPAPNDTLHITASIPYQGIPGTGDAYVYLSPQNATLTNPVVLIEGFDFTNSMNWDELYALLNREQLIETLRSLGYDAVVLNFTNAVDYIQRNGLMTVELLEQVQAAIGPGRDYVVVGASMGGIVGRYALAYMESHAMPHAVRTFIAFDSPQAGADIPLGIQYWLAFFADLSPDAAALLAALDSPGARQMLAYHHTDPPGTTGQSDPLRATLLADLAALGSYPTNPRLVAVANGSGQRQNQGFLAGAQIIRYEYSSFLVDIIGNVWAVPNAANQTIFHGLIDFILLPPDESTIAVNGTRPFDNAPGGWRDSMAEMDQVPAPYGDIVALFPNHCFIPAISSLDLATQDPFYDIAGDPNLLAHTPFDAVYFPGANQEHVAVTPENAQWLLAEIQAGSASVAAEVPALPLRAAIEPLGLSAASAAIPIRFTVPHAGTARLAVYDAAGRQVALLLDRRYEPGTWEAVWNGRVTGGERASTGVYFVGLRGDDFAASRKLVILR
jgi:hypothetical protein